MTLHKEVFSALELPVLTALFRDADLKIVDIGGRDSAFAGALPLAPFTHYYVAEPDAQEAERLQEELPRVTPWRAVTVIKQAIAPHRGEATLHITRKPGMSSLLEPDREVTRRYCLNRKFEVVSDVTVPTLPLDDAAATYGFTDAAFLKVDTQGTELDILRSGAHLVRESLLGIHTEAEFQPFYKGQALFADVDQHLRANGFMLVSLSRTALRRAHYRKDLFSKRVTTWAHCLYLREPRGLLLRGGDVPRDVARLLALTIAFEHYDLAFEVLDLAREVHLLPEADVNRARSEVEQIARLSTRRLLHVKREEAEPEDLLAPASRDTRLE